MAKTEVNRNQTATGVQAQHQEDVSLKGTFVSVMLLGGFLALTWLGVFILFISRS